MIYFKLTPSEIRSFNKVNGYFDTNFQDSWIDDSDFAKKLISEIDNSDWLGGGLLYQRLFETRYNFTGLCHGTKSVILQKYFNQFWYSSTGIGNNIYPLLSECPWDLHFIGGTNFYAWGEISGHNFSEPIYMVDFDREVNNKYEFQECLDKWRKF